MAKKPQNLETPLQRILARSASGTSWYRAHMDDYYEDSEKPRYDPGWFHPSSLSHPCDAYLAFEYLGLQQRPGNVKSKLRRVFDNGHSTESRWQVAIAKAGLAQLGNVEGDRNFELPKLRIRGEMDNIIKRPTNGQLYIWEFKTKREDLFDAMREPDASWIPQIHCYMFAKGILQTLVTVECKNCQEYKEYEVQFNNSVWDNIVERTTRIRERLENKQEVLRTPIQFESSCTFHPLCAAHDFSKGTG